MKAKVLSVFKKSKRVIKDKKGISYLEFSMAFFMYVILIFMALQAFGILSAQVLIMNTTRSVLRQVELNGGPPANLVDDVKFSLAKSHAIDQDSIKILLTDPLDNNKMANIDNLGEVKYQLRNKVAVQLVVNYRISAFGPSLESISYPIPLTSKYTGTSEKFFKDGGPYTEVTE